MKLVTPKDLGSNIHPSGTILKILFIATLFIKSFGTWHYFIYFVFSLYKHLKAHTFGFLEVYDK